MDLVGYKEDYNAEYIRELLLTELPGKQLQHAMELLKGEKFVPPPVRKVCIGAYILLQKEPDPLYKKLNFVNKQLERSERDQLVKLLKRVDLNEITAKFTARAREHDQLVELLKRADLETIRPEFTTQAAPASSRV